MSRRKLKKLNISLNSLIILALILISVFFVWQNTVLRNRIAKLQLPPSPSPQSTPVSPTPSPTDKSNAQDGCVITGCSGQVCADEEVITTCEYEQSYACYDGATCERQDDGECGWTQTEELISCLNSP